MYVCMYVCVLQPNRQRVRLGCWILSWGDARRQEAKQSFRIPSSKKKRPVSKYLVGVFGEKHEINRRECVPVLSPSQSGRP
jgi:hypothetical protein